MTAGIKITDVNNLGEIKKIETMEFNFFQNRALTTGSLAPVSKFLGFILAAKLDDEIIGYTVFTASNNPHEYYCATLAVKPEHRARGIATQLISSAEDRCRSIGIRVLIATASPSNTASCKVFINNNNWMATDIFENFYEQDTNSFLLKKELDSEPDFSDEKTVDVNAIKELKRLFSEGYCGTKVILNDNIMMMKRI